MGDQNVEVFRASVVKIIAESLSQHDENVLYQLSEIRVGRTKKE
jgi:hypothetical protein